MLEEKPCKQFDTFWMSPHYPHRWTDWDGVFDDTYWCPGRPPLEQAPASSWKD